MNELTSDEIWNLLKTDKKRKWHRDNENPNIFRSESLEVLFVYPTCIKYWEDLRCSIVVESPRPTNNQELFKAIV